MFRPAARALARAPAVAHGPAKRLISTGPTKSRSWKNSVVRLGLAAGAVYYYNTSSVFAETPSFSALALLRKENDDDASLPTLDSVTPKIRQERAAESAAKTDTPALEGGVNPQELEEEAGQEAAFNPETGEINWDCPCLGGMAHGPCGEEFKAAFSCFVYSTEEPKGMDCIEKFKGMQDCFRQHPDVYGAELEDDEPEGAPASSEQPATAAETDASSHPQEKQSESDSLVPEAWHDTEENNQAAKKTEN
ncbi:hypothetical protein NUU61_002411 [Penicillium alfredii]|uniref:Mitochondrial intermembrane space import and assembly protein 40 n=1 Tax=Penicillium alfredii TaxID=1506179 RepID=A0A9W9FRM9_9EURO|nr:uncharacterized protein NUU61_002411 [Penicillium alfredii]KAJ5105064.1 hypothetical protein NUU61_002411 [Penicillium alfredii]